MGMKCKRVRNKCLCMFFGGFNIVVNLSKTVIQLVKGRQQTNFRKLLYVT